MLGARIHGDDMHRIAEETILGAVTPHLQMYESYRSELCALASRAATKAASALEDTSDPRTAVEQLEAVRRALAGDLFEFMPTETASSLASLVIGVVIKEEAKRPEMQEFIGHLSDNGFLRSG